MAILLKGPWALQSCIFSQKNIFLFSLSLEELYAKLGFKPDISNQVLSFPQPYPCPSLQDWQPRSGSGASLLLHVCQGTRQHCSPWHSDKQLITVITAELDTLLLWASSAFMWTNKLEEQHMDGEQRLNAKSLCLHQQGQGAHALHVSVCSACHLYGKATRPVGPVGWNHGPAAAPWSAQGCTVSWASCGACLVAAVWQEMKACPLPFCRRGC